VWGGSVVGGDQLTHRVPARERVHSLVDVGEAKRAGLQSLHRKLPGRPEPEQTRNVSLRRRRAHVRADDRATVADERGCGQRHRRARVG